MSRSILALFVGFFLLHSAKADSPSPTIRRLSLDSHRSTCSPNENGKINSA
jgi:hypothetical protein